MEPKNNKNSSLEDAVRELMRNSSPEDAGKTLTDLLNKIQKEDAEARERNKEKEERRAARDNYVLKWNRYVSCKQSSELTVDDAITALILALDNEIKDWTAEDMREAEKMFKETFADVVKACNEANGLIKKLEDAALEPEALERFFKLFKI